MAISLEASQCGGRIGMGTDSATHFITAKLHMHMGAGKSSIALFANLKAAFYIVIRQSLCNMPAEREDSELALSNLP
eukprot:2478793-Pyramimonas_sp.AAC.1